MTIRPKKWMSKKPEHCDLCNYAFGKTFVDGKTMQGPWGILCSTCHEAYGVGLGVGRGQKYDLETLEKLEG
jgi:hypothetical protein